MSRDTDKQLSSEISRYIIESSSVPAPTPENTPEDTAPFDYEKPHKRGECLQGENAQRPCPYVSCKYHLFLDVDAYGKITINSPVPVEEMQHSCALDVSESPHEVTLDMIGKLYSVTRERIRQIEEKGLRKLRAMSPKRRLELLDSLPEDPPTRPGVPTLPKPTLR